MNFFRRLRARTERDPDSRAEQALFRKLDAEFAENAGNSRSSAGEGFWGIFSRFAILRYAPLTAVVLGLVIVTGQFLPKRGTSNAPVSISEADAEFYEGLEDWMLSASDEDWEAILASEGDGG